MVWNDRFLLLTISPVQKTIIHAPKHLMFTSVFIGGCPVIVGSILANTGYTLLIWGSWSWISRTSTGAGFCTSLRIKPLRRFLGSISRLRDWLSFGPPCLPYTHPFYHVQWRPFLDVLKRIRRRQNDLNSSIQVQVQQ